MAVDQDGMRAVPSVEAVLAVVRQESPAAGHVAAREVIRGLLAEARTAVRGGAPAPDAASVARAAVARLNRGASLRRVVNASGVLLQTNLGRAPLGQSALAAMHDVGRGYSNLEYDLERGERGSRHEHVRHLLRLVTSAEDGLAVNNNAAALFMVLSALCAGREVIVSRGEAVEIGGGFRIPDILRQSGARLVEVGTTNRTYARDYAEAITPDTSAILRVHTSNFRITGFTATPARADLSRVARAAGVLLLDDLGSGCVVDTTRYGLPHEPTVQEALREGADLALFSGDKLLGGPQAGLIAGRADLVAALRRHPLARVLRVDKVTIAALNATLESYAEGREAQEIPLWRMLATPEASVRRRARRWAAAAGDRATVVLATTLVGGGALPEAGVATWCAALCGPLGADELARELRACRPPIIARVADDHVLLDPRTVDPADDAAVIAAVKVLCVKDR